MRDPDPAARHSGAGRRSPTASRGPLTEAPRGAEVRVVALPAAAAADLVDEGLVSGTVVTVGARAPFGGPLLLEVGRARVAVSRSVASGILVEPAGIDR